MKSSDRAPASARDRDSFTFASRLPTLSVLPAIRRYALPNVAARSTTWVSSTALAFSSRVDEPVGK